MASSAQVGNLRVVFSADTAQFTRAMEDATGKVEDLGKKLISELEPRQRAVNAAVRDFLGANEIRRAQEYVQAVEKIGDVSKITAQDQARINKALTEALGHYKALGQDAPKAMTDLHAATSGAVKPLETTRDTLGQIWSSIKGAAGIIGVTFSVGAIVNFGKAIFDTASQIHDMSSALGFSAEAFQRNKFAAEQSGGSVDAFTRAAQKLNDNLAEGSKSTVEALKTAGLQFDAIRRMKPEDAWIAVADAVGRMQDPMDRARVAQDLFGKGALQLLPGMIEGYRKLGEAATVMSNETVDRLEKAQDSWDRFWNKITITSANALDAIFSFSDRLGDAIAQAAKQAGTSVDVMAQQVYKMSRAQQEAFVATFEESKKKTDEFNKALAEYHQRLSRTIPLTEEQREAQRKAAAAAEAHATAIKKITDSLSGADLQQKVRDLREAFDRLTPAQKSSADVMARVTEEAMKLKKAGAELDPVLNSLARQMSFFADMAHDTRGGLLALNAPNALPQVLANYKALDEAHVQYARDFIASKTTIDVAAESIKTSLVKLKPPPDPWKEFKDHVKSVGQEIEQSIADHLAGMISRTESFRDAMKAIWQDLKRGIVDILSEILREFETRFLKGLIGAILGQKNAFAGAFAGVFGGAMDAGKGVIDSRVPEIFGPAGTAAGTAWGSAFTVAGYAALAALATYAAVKWGPDLAKALQAGVGSVAQGIGDLVFGGGFGSGTGPQTPVTDPNTGQVIYDPNRPNDPTPGFDPGNPWQNGDMGSSGGDNGVGTLAYARPTMGVDFGGSAEAMDIGSSQMMNVVIEQDGRQTARVVFPYLAGESTRLGLNRI